MALSNGHQAVIDISFGETDFDEKAGVVILKNVRSYPPSCTNPPPGMTSQAWLDGGIPKTCDRKP
jgi:branched-chain amino acid transport system substrate-binding protein